MGCGPSKSSRDREREHRRERAVLDHNRRREESRIWDSYFDGNNMTVFDMGHVMGRNGRRDRGSRRSGRRWALKDLAPEPRRF